MDLNQLYFDHQLLLMKADRAGTAHLRRRHEIAASSVAGRIGSLQTRLGATGAPAWDALATAHDLPTVSSGLHFEGKTS